MYLCFFFWFTNRQNTGFGVDRSIVFFKKKCDDSNRSRVGSLVFQLSSVRASHRDDATRRDATRVVSRKNSRRKNLFVSLRVSSRSLLRRAWRHSRPEIHTHDDAVDVANMPRCGNGSGDDDEDATRRCDDGDDGDDATAGWWNGIFVVERAARTTT